MYCIISILENVKVFLTVTDFPHSRNSQNIGVSPAAHIYVVKKPTENTYQYKLH